MIGGRQVGAAPGEAHEPAAAPAGLPLVCRRIALTVSGWRPSSSK